MKSINLRVQVPAKYKQIINKWVSFHYLNLAVFNLLLMVLILLHTARYFDPFWLISINTIVFISLIMSVVLLHARSRTLFFITFLFWLASMVVRMAGVEVWAERISIYVFQSLLLGVILLFFEEKDKTIG